MKIKIEVQYILECQNSQELARRVKLAIKNLDVKYSEQIIDSNNITKAIGFRGSPTLLINGEDYEGLKEVKNIGLSCRYYKDGLPSVEEIKNKILSIINRSSNGKDGKNYIFCIGLVAGTFLFK
jgi:hypothetical protein